MPGILKPIVPAFAQTFEVIKSHFESLESLETLLPRYGWLLSLKEMPGVFLNLNNFGSDLAKLFDELSSLVDIGNELSLATDPENDLLAELQELYRIIKEVFHTIVQLRDRESGGATNSANDFDQAFFLKDIAQKLLYDTLVQTLERHYPSIYAFFHLFGIIEYEEKQPAGDYRINYTETRIHWDRLSGFVSGPGDLFRQVYHWKALAPNEPQVFQWEKLLHHIERAFLANRFLMRYVLPRRSVVDPGAAGDSKPFADFVTPQYMAEQDLHELQFPLVYGSSLWDESFYNISLALMPIARTRQWDRSPQGLLITPILQGSLSQSFLLTPEISLDLEAMADASNVLAVALFPDTAKVIWNTPEAAFAIGMTGAPYHPWTLLGAPDSHRLELYGFELKLSASGPVDDPEVKIAFKAAASEPGERGVKAILATGEADAFITENASSDRIEAGFDLEIEWSNKTGFRFGGSAGFDLQLQLNQKLGPITISNFYLNLGEGPKKTSQKSTRLRTGLGLQGELGPVRFVIEDTGFALDIIPYDYEADLKQGTDPPLLGLLDLDLRYVPPRGIGFLIDASSVQGGGYLEFQPDRGRYFGYAELSIADKFTVKAIGVIDTRLPDGQDGYSFLLLITAEFDPVQLGFGFSLEGVGGLIGIHRRMNLEGLREQVKQDTFDQILFPADPLNNMQSIVASLDTLFPQAKGQYSFGITGKLRWGSSGLIVIKAGFLLQLPAFRIALIGTAKSEIVRTIEPEEEGQEPETKVLFRIQLNFAATYDPAKALFTFDASLYQSEILGLPLSGDAAIRLRGGDDPYFMMSLGGFHPRFQPPKGLGLPDMKRIELPVHTNLASLELSARFYCAITSNTLQFGAAAEAAFGGSGFRVSGKVGFDALFQFRPVYFIVDAYGEVTIHIWGGSWSLGVHGTIEGPYPFIFSLYVTISLGWLGSRRVAIPPFRIGRAAREPLPEIDLLQELRLALEDVRNWRPVLPARTNLLVALRKAEDDIPAGAAAEAAEREPRFHPVGGVEIVQDRLPLEVTLERFGHHRPAKYNHFQLAPGDGQEAAAVVRQFFAPAQYFNLSREEELSRASFEKMPAGLQMQGSDRITTGRRLLTKAVVYELVDAGSDGKIREVPLPQQEFRRRVQQSSIAVSDLGRKQARRQERSAGLALREEAFVIVSHSKLPGFHPVKTRTRTEALQQLGSILKTRPEWTDELAVVPEFETL